MNIFICYPAAERILAKQLYLALCQEDENVFFGDESVRTSQSFDGPIRDAVRRSDVFIFFITPESVRAGSYTRSELAMAGDTYKRSSRVILPVLIHKTDEREIPQQLKDLGILDPGGNAIADITARLDGVRRMPPWRRFPRRAVAIALLGGTLLSGGTVTALYVAQRNESAHSAAESVAYLNQQMTTLSVLNVSNPHTIGLIQVRVPHFAIHGCELEYVQTLYKPYTIPFRQTLTVHVKIGDLQNPKLVLDGIWGDDESQRAPSIALMTTKTLMTATEWTSKTHKTVGKRFDRVWLGFQLPELAQNVEAHISDVIRLCRTRS